MKLMDWIDRAPLRVGFGQSGGGTGAFDVTRDPTSVSLVTRTGVTTDLPTVTGFDAGLMSAADKTKLDGLANTTVSIDPSSFDSRAQIAATSVDPAIQFIRTAGYTTPGDGGAGLYVRAASEPTHTMKVQSVDGAFWEFVAEHGTVTEKQAGGIGDGVADDTQAIQAAIDFAMYRNPPANSGQPIEVLIVGPVCRITDTIHLGYGETIHGVSVRGVARKRRAEISYVGASLVATFTDRPIISIQGIRGGVLRDIWIEGALDYSGLNSESYEITQETTWDAMGGDGRYNPYAGIAIDAFCGPRPVGSYPDMNYPDYIFSQDQYNKVFSTDIRIENVGIRAVNTAFVVQPSDHDANGDFTKIVNCSIEQCKYGISVGNSQSRNVEVRNLLGVNVFTILTNNVHGRRSGRFGGPIDNLSLGGYVGRIFKFGSTALLGTTLFTTLYVEGLERIGDFDGNTSAEGALTFDSCLFSFRHNEVRGVPANVMGTGNSSSIIFRSCRFANAPSVYSFNMPRVYFEHCSVSVQDRSSGTLPRYEAFAHNVLSGGVVLDPLHLRPQQIRFPKANLETGAIASGISPDEGFTRDTDRNTCIPLAVWEYGRLSENYATPSRKRFNYFERSRNVHFASVDLTGRTLTLEFNALSDHEAMRLGVLPGDVIRDKITGMVFFICSRVGTTVMAVAQNNYRDDGTGNIVTLLPFDPASGGLQFINSRLFTPSYLTLADFEQGSNIATGAARNDGFASYLDTDLVPGDYLFADQDADRVFASGEAEVVSIDTANDTITFAGNARSTVARKQLTQWIRQPPPNV